MKHLGYQDSSPWKLTLKDIQKKILMSVFEQSSDTKSLEQILQSIDLILNKQMYFQPAKKQTHTQIQVI